MAHRINRLKIYKMLPKHLRNSLLIIGLVILPSIIYAQSIDDCLMCHSDNELTMEKNGKEISLFVDENTYKASTHSKLTCVSCHKGYDPEELPHAEKVVQINCLNCHQSALTKHAFHPQILKSKGFGSAKDVSCTNCHGVHDVKSPKSKSSRWFRANIISSCGSCHKEIKETFLDSKHYTAVKNNIKGAPDCLSCHLSPVSHTFFDNDTLKTKIAQEKLCLSCHIDNEEIKNIIAPSAGFITQYEKSVHGSALNSGNPKSATCVDCHNSHSVISETLSHSSVFKSNIPTTCSKCHGDIASEYNESIHGKLVAQGNMDSPSCTDCHGEHNILKTDDPNAPVAPLNVSNQICSPCHSSLRLTDKYGIQADRFKTFSDSYHGLAIRGGSVEVANCASCHGVHNIKPSSDPTSTISKNNLAKTCGSCHPGANTQFVTGKIHVTLDETEEPILYWIAYIYISMIVSVIGIMFLHNAVDFFKKSKIKKLKQIGAIESEYHGHSLYLRMSVNERIQHITMALSFIILVITGFMLRYPESWWVSHIRDLSSDAFEYRSLIHRIAAVIMVAISLYHIYYIAITTRGRQLVKDLFPKFQDFKDAIGVAKYNLGLQNEKPKLDRFSYVEKAEYWALVWGTIVMTVTGLLMWIYTDLAGSFSKLEYDIARTIHYYEAWLAFLAIVVWHFYFVIFNPDVYPMSLAWLKGTISEEEMAEEHPLELERIKRSEQKDKDSES